MYAIVVATNIGIFVLLALSLNIIAGYAGQSSIGHAAFFGIGAYTSAVLTSTLGVNFWLSLPIAFVITGLIGALLGLASMRVREDFLAITTIGINFVVVAIFQYAPVFGASLGMSVSKPSIFGVKMDNLMFLVLVGILIIAMVLFMRMIERSWFGLALASIRNDEAAASSLGVNIVKFKVLAFAVGTAVAGLAGGVYAHYMTFIYSSDFAFLVSISILSMVVIGGIGTIRGPIVGAIILGLAPELFRFISDYRMIVYGGLLVVMMLFQPQGIVGKGSFLASRFDALFGKGRKKSVVS